MYLREVLKIFSKWRINAYWSLKVVLKHVRDDVSVIEIAKAS